MKCLLHPVHGMERADSPEGTSRPPVAARPSPAAEGTYNSHALLDSLGKPRSVIRLEGAQLVLVPSGSAQGHSPLSSTLTWSSASAPLFNSAPALSLTHDVCSLTPRFSILQYIPGPARQENPLSFCPQLLL